MKVVILLGLVAAACAKVVPEPVHDAPYSIIAEVLIPRGEEIRKLEEREISQRIVGGSAAQEGQFPHQAGLLAEFNAGTGVCGGSLVGRTIVITAAHCWWDGVNQASQFTVVLGSVRLFHGGTRIVTGNVVMHPQWTPSLIRNDVAVIILPSPVSYSANIQPLSLPTGSELNELFVGERARATGFGRHVDGAPITTDQHKRYVYSTVITNLQCSRNFPLIVQSSNICISGANGQSTCQGDSGGPLTVYRNGRDILIGITSFGSARGCSIGVPAAFARVTSFMDFFNLFPIGT